LGSCFTSACAIFAGFFLSWFSRGLITIRFLILFIPLRLAFFCLLRLCVGWSFFNPLFFFQQSSRHRPTTTPPVPVPLPFLPFFFCLPRAILPFRATMLCFLINSGSSPNAKALLPPDNCKTELSGYALFFPLLTSLCPSPAPRRLTGLVEN